MHDGWKVSSLAKAVGPKGRVIGGPFGSNLVQSDYVLGRHSGNSRVQPNRFHN